MAESEQDKLQQDMYNDAHDAWECLHQMGEPEGADRFFYVRALADLTACIHRHEKSALVQRRKEALSGS